MSRRRPAPRAWLAGAAAASAVTLTWQVARDAAASERWRRRNYRDREVSLLLGPAVGAGALAGLLAGERPGRRDALVIVASAAAVGAYDDLYGDRHARGLGGHLRALRAGRVTTGMVKLVSLTAAAAVSSRHRHREPVDALLGTVLVAGGANLVNLFDLRPGRAAKLTVLVASALGAAVIEPEARIAAAVAAGAAAAALPPDLGERAMLGDCGAGTLGALLGWAAATAGSRRRRAGLAAAVIGLTLASERVSFSAIIERQPLLRGLDQLGRPPA